MARHIVARTTDIPPGGNKVVDVEGRDIVVFHVNGEFFALLNRCPHAGAPLDKAACVARLTSPEPGVYQRSRVGELLRCAKQNAPGMGDSAWYRILKGASQDGLIQFTEQAHGAKKYWIGV